MLRTSSCDTSDSEQQMSPYSPNKPLCNGGYPRPQGEENQSDLSPHLTLSLFDKLALSHNVWLQLGVESVRVKEILKRQPPGAFLVWSNNCGKNKILTVRLENGMSESEDFIVKEDASVFYLEHSYLGFCSIFQLIGYYCVSRDVLPFRLKLPPAILHTTSREELGKISALGIVFWDSPFNQKPDGFSQETTSNVMEVNPTLELLKRQHLPMCSIQVRADNGALFFINPLFLKEHGVGWFAQTPVRAHTFRHSRLATKCRKPSAGCEASPVSPRESQEVVERTGSDRSDSGKSLEEEEIFKGPISGGERDTASERNTTSDHALTALRRKNFTRRAAWSWGDDSESDHPERKSAEEERARPRSAGTETGARESRTLPAHYRASWLEGGGQGTLATLKKSHSETSLLACDSLLLPSISELDSLSISSVEDESDGPNPAQQQKRHSCTLSDKVRYRLSAVSHAFTGLVSTDRRIQNKIVELAQDKSSYFGNLVQGFISYTAENKDKQASSTEMLQGVHHMITSLRNYLLQSSELTRILDLADHEECNTDAAIEKAVLKCVLKPLRAHIYSCLLDFHTKDGSLKKLKDNQLVLQSQSLAKLGVTASVPDAVGLEKIQQKFNAVHSAYSPWKKVAQLLKACKLIYEAMTGASGKPYGADDFLPVLTYVLASSNITNLSLDVEYMMELLDQTQLQGEGGYYLTTMFGALYHISNFQPRLLTRQMSDEAKSSLHQWRRRRTLHHTQSKRRSAQDLLHVSLREPSSDQVTILAPAHMSVTEVRKACAEKFEVLDPESYGLFAVRGDVYQLLDEDSCPQKVKEDLRQKAGPTFYFVYGPKDRTEPPKSPSGGTADPVMIGCPGTESKGFAQAALV